LDAHDYIVSNGFAFSVFNCNDFAFSVFHCNTHSVIHRLIVYVCICIAYSGWHCDVFTVKLCVSFFVCIVEFNGVCDTNAVRNAIAHSHSHADAITIAPSVFNIVKLRVGVQYCGTYAHADPKHIAIYHRHGNNCTVALADELEISCIGDAIRLTHAKCCSNAHSLTHCDPDFNEDADELGY